LNFLDVVSTVIFRTDEQKRDFVGSWNRPDRPFFAASACHVLAAAFLQTYPSIGYTAVLVRPSKGFRGTHVVVTDEKTVFDYHGYPRRAFYFDHHFTKMRRFFPGWSAELIPLSESPIDWSFCHVHRHRHPSQFFQNPLPRALAFVQRFPSPQEAGFANTP
jgi:hypothetical protein